jgi:hypothetical protein
MRILSGKRAIMLLAGGLTGVGAERFWLREGKEDVNNFPKNL